MGFLSRGLGFVLALGQDDVALSDAMPPAEATTPTPGSASKASRDDHRHPRLTSSHGGQTLDGSGTAVITFTRTFDTEPSIVITGKTIGGAMPALFDYTLIQANGLYTGVTVKGYKGQAVAVSILGTNVNAFAGNPAGLSFSLIAIQAS